MKKNVLELMIFLLLLPGLQPANAQNSIDEIINDITLPHEGRPHGVPSNYDWALKPRRGAVQPPEGWTAMIAWGQLYEWINGNPAINTRVQLKDMEAYYLSKTDGTWHLLQKDARVSGSAYVEDFAGDVNKPADIRTEKSGGISVTAGDGYNFHFWPSKGRTKFPQNDVEACFVTLLARLILDDPNGVDDRADAKYVLSVGGDWWLSLTAPWDNWKTNADIGIGRFKFVTTEWKSFNLITASEKTVRNNPPPCLCAADGVENMGMDSLLPAHYRLDQNYPNPFNPTSTISYSIPEDGFVRLEVFDISGKRVAALVDEPQPAGDYVAAWNAGDLPSGVYLYRLQVNGYSAFKKLLLQK